MWIIMISPNKVVFAKFKILLIKMAQDASIHETIKVNYEYLCDSEIVLQLTGVVPMLEIVWGLNKYV
jgi:hypothetical protein